MNYAEVLDCDVVNGKQVGISFFAQGCPSPIAKDALIL